MKNTSPEIANIAWILVWMIAFSASVPKINLLNGSRKKAVLRVRFLPVLKPAGLKQQGSRKSTLACGGTSHEVHVFFNMCLNLNKLKIFGNCHCSSTPKKSPKHKVKVRLLISVWQRLWWQAQIDDFDWERCGKRNISETLQKVAGPAVKKSVATTRKKRKRQTEMERDRARDKKRCWATQRCRKKDRRNTNR